MLGVEDRARAALAVLGAVVLTGCCIDNVVFVADPSVAFPLNTPACAATCITKKNINTARELHNSEKC